MHQSLVSRCVEHGRDLRIAGTATAVTAHPLRYSSLIARLAVGDAADSREFELYCSRIGASRLVGQVGWGGDGC
jgi:hypothetical protein